MKKKNLLLAVAACILSSCGTPETPQGDPGVVYIDIINKGYGTAFIDALADAFTEKTGIKVLAELPIDPNIAKLVDAGEIEEYETNALDKIIEVLKF